MENLKIKKATYLEWEYIRNLRNDFKEGFIEQSCISPEQHHNWMIHNQSQGGEYYIAWYLNSKTEFYDKCGFVGCKYNGHYIPYDIRFIVHPSYQGLGVGTELLKFIIKEFNGNVEGKVKLNNEASNIAFIKAGYKRIRTDSEFNYYRVE